MLKLDKLQRKKLQIRCFARHEKLLLAKIAIFLESPSRIGLQRNIFSSVVSGETKKILRRNVTLDIIKTGGVGCK